MIPDLRLISGCTIHHGADAHTGEEFLLRTYTDGSQTVARRPDSSATWSPEVELREVAS